MTHGVCQHMLEHLLLLCAVSLWSNADGYDGNHQGNPITSHKQVERPNCGIEDLHHHTVQLDSFQQHPHKDGQEEEMEHHCNKPAATLSEDQSKKEALSLVTQQELETFDTSAQNLTSIAENSMQSL